MNYFNPFFCCIWLLLFFSTTAFAQEPKDAYFQQADKLFSTGEYKQALSLYQKSSTRYPVGSEQQTIASAMAGIALIYDQKVKESYEQFKETDKKLRDGKAELPKNLDLRVYIYLGKYHLHYKENDLALPFLKEAENKAKQLGSRANAYALVELNHVLGDFYFDKKQYQRAQPYYLAAEATAQKQGTELINYEQLGEHKIRLGEIHEDKEELKEAIGKYKSILAEKDKLLEKDPQKAGALLYRIGRVYYRQKEFEVAEPYLVEALGFSLSAEQVSETELMLAVILAAKKEYNNALVQNSKALEEWKNRSDKDPNKKFEGLLNFGAVYRKIPPLSEAEQLYQKTLDKTSPSWSMEASLKQQQLDKILHLTNPQVSDNYNFALLSYERANSTIKELPKKEKEQASIKVLMAKGALYFEAKDYKKAKFNYEKALELMKGVYEPKHPLVSEASRALGEIYYEEKVFGEALQFVNKALTASLEEGINASGDAIPDINKAQFPYELLYALGVKGSILRELKNKDATEADLQKSLEAFESLIQLLSELRKTYRSEGAKYQLSELAHKFSQQAIMTCEALYLKTQNKDYLKKAFSFMEETRSAILLQTIQNMKARKVANIPENLLQKENALKVQIAYLEGEVYHELMKGKEKDKARLIKLKEELKLIKEEHQSFVEGLEKNYPKYYKLKYDYRQLKVEDLQAILKKDEVFFEYTLLDSAVFVLRITQLDIECQKLTLMGAKAIFLKVSELIVSIETLKNKEFATLSHELYQALFGNMLKQLNGKKLVIVPDGELNYLPFELLLLEPYLPSSEDDYSKMDYLLHHHAVSYSYSAALFLDSRAKKYENKIKKFLGLSPDYELIRKSMENKQEQDKEIAELGELPHALKEVEAIAKLIKGNAFLKEKATEELFKLNAKDYAVLHLATHGTLNNVNPLFSRLILMGSEKEDGSLFTYELFNLELNAELVTLSACNTGIGALQKGEGAMSLAKGFAYAGCANMVMSLWPVSDYSTGKIMLSFYAYLEKGYDKDEALRKAKLDFIKEADGKLAAPMFWAAFIITGNPDPVFSLEDPVSYSLWQIGMIFLTTILVVGGILYIVRKRTKSA